MKKIVFFTLIFISLNLKAYKLDSTFNIGFTTGSYIFEFNKDLTSLNNQNGGFRFHSIGLFGNYCFGIKLQKKITNKKQITFSTIYSNAEIEYLRHTKFSFNDGTFLKLKLKGIVFNTMIQYKVFKNLKFNYGISHYLNIVNKFDNVEVAKEVNWYDENEKSRLNKYSIGISTGLEFNLFRRFSAEFNMMSGLNELITLKLKNDNSNFEFPQKIRYMGLSINYKLL
ncbi:MAG: hypothetical protein Q8K70_07470 [Bacteroidota bacterium]|nr:hypothetical protein [Bacteroidota bacterium]